MTRSIAAAFLVLFFAASPAIAQSRMSLKPLLTIPKTIVVQDDFSKEEPLKKDVWLARQGT